MQKGWVFLLDSSSDRLRPSSSSTWDTIASLRRRHKATNVFNKQKKKICTHTGTCTLFGLFLNSFITQQEHKKCTSQNPLLKLEEI